MIWASNGDVALERFEANADKLSLLITDVMMPLMNGPELARLRRLHFDCRDDELDVCRECEGYVL